MIEQGPTEGRLVALETELAYEQRNLRTLLAVARASRGVTDPNVVLMAIYTQLSALLPVDAFSVALCTNDQPDSYRYMLFIDEGTYYQEADIRTGGLTGFMVRQQRPLLFRDLHEDYPSMLPRPQAFGNMSRRSRSWMGVPLLAGRTALGAMTVQSYQPGMYNEADLELTQALADLAAIAIDNSLLYEQQAELTRSLAARVTARQEELAVLSALAAGLSRGEASPALLDEALERVLWLFGLDAGIVWLHDRRVSLRRAAWRATGEPPEAEERLQINGGSLEAEVVRSGKLLQQPIAEGHWVCAVPLQAQGRYVGVMTLWGTRALQDHETALLVAAGDQIALGIENSRLLQEREHQIAQLEALSTIAEVSAANRELRPMLQAVCVNLQAFLQIDGFLAALYNPGAHELIEGIGWHRAAGLRPVDMPVHPGSYVAELLQGDQPLLLRRPDELQAGEWWEQGAANWIGVPLFGHANEVVGVLAIQSAQPEAFDRRDLQFMTNVAHQLALNVVNVQLYANARISAAVAERRANNLALLHSIARLVSSSLDPAEVLRIAAEQLSQLFVVDHCAVTLFRDDGETGEIVAEFPALGFSGIRFGPQDMVPFQPAPGSEQPVLITDVRTVELGPVRLLMQTHRFQAMLVVPLVTRGQTFGSIALQMCTPINFLEEDFELCRTIAAQVTTALENARLHQMSVTRVEQELDIARSIQANLFPRTLPSIPGMHLAGRCIPAFETGGDFYDVLPLGNDRYGFSIGDVSGKSLSAAMLMAVARSIVRSEAINHAAPDTVVTETNRLIAQDIPPNSFVALCYAVYDARTYELTVTNGGQITPLVRHANGEVHWLPVQPNLPLGVVPDLQYHATSIQLAAGDTVLFLTDGLIEAFSPSREMYGFERIQGLFAACGMQPPDEVVFTMLDELCVWQGNENRHDDMTVIVAQIA